LFLSIGGILAAVLDPPYTGSVAHAAGGSFTFPATWSTASAVYSPNANANDTHVPAEPWSHDRHGVPYFRW
jgi:hypothetical protein